MLWRIPVQCLSRLNSLDRARDKFLLLIDVRLSSSRLYSPVLQCDPDSVGQKKAQQTSTFGFQKFHLRNRHCTIVNRGPRIMAKIFGIFGTKTCSFIKENRTKNGPLVFRTVLCSKHDEKLGNCQRKTLRQVVGCGIVRF